jgi:hypothetical protein
MYTAPGEVFSEDSTYNLRMSLANRLDFAVGFSTVTVVLRRSDGTVVASTPATVSAGTFTTVELEYTANANDEGWPIQFGILVTGLGTGSYRQMMFDEVAFGVTPPAGAANQDGLLAIGNADFESGSALVEGVQSAFFEPTDWVAGPSCSVGRMDPRDASLPGDGANGSLTLVCDATQTSLTAAAYSPVLEGAVQGGRLHTLRFRSARLAEYAAPQQVAALLFVRGADGEMHRVFEAEFHPTLGAWRDQEFGWIPDAALDGRDLQVAFFSYHFDGETGVAFDDVSLEVSAAVNPSAIANIATDAGFEAAGIGAPGGVGASLRWTPRAACGGGIWWPNSAAFAIPLAAPAAGVKVAYVNLGGASLSCYLSEFLPSANLAWGERHLVSAAVGRRADFATPDQGYVETGYSERVRAWSLDGPVGGWQRVGAVFTPTFDEALAQTIRIGSSQTTTSSTQVQFDSVVLGQIP